MTELKLFDVPEVIIVHAVPKVPPLLEGSEEMRMVPEKPTIMKELFE